MKLIEPKNPQDFEKYYELRWRVLRKPWNQPQGSEQDLEENGAYHIMAIENGQALGVARLQFPAEDPASAQLRYMAVDESSQGKGIGRCIIEHMEQYARQHDAKHLFFHARDNALGFYQKLGYRTDKESYLLFGSIQHYQMSKSL